MPKEGFIIDVATKLTSREMVALLAAKEGFVVDLATKTIMAGGTRLTSREMVSLLVALEDAYDKGFKAAKSGALKIVDEWSRACHPKHPKEDPKNPTKNRCWQNHGLRCAGASIKRDL